LKKIESIIKWYDSIQDKYQKFMEYVIVLIKDNFKSNKIIIHNINGRIKSKDSFINKALKDKYKDPIDDIKDIIGLRIISYIENEIYGISEKLSLIFDIVEEHSIDKSEELGINKIGYRSLHKIIKLKDNDPNFKEYEGICIEVQIRSILEHTWAEIEHDKNYKFNGELPSKLKRQLNLISGALELIDKNINATVEEIDQYVKNTSRLINEKQYKNIDISTISLTNFLSEKFKKSISNGLTADYGNTKHRDKFAVSELNKFGISTIEELDKIIPEDIEEKIADHLVKSNFFGLLTILMLINNYQKYFNEVIDVKALIFRPTGIKALLNYKINVFDLIKKQKIYVVDDNGDFIEENELFEFLKVDK